MPIRLAFLILIVAALGPVGCTKTNPAYCLSNDECPGLCNMDTHACEGSAEDAGSPDAVIPPDAMTCGGNDECLAERAPICDTTTSVCRGCAGTGATSECTQLLASTPYCADDGRCAPCAGIEGCSGDAFAPVCDTVNLECRACEGSGVVSECMDVDSTRPRCAVDGRCVECEAHGDCTSEVCNEPAGTCVSSSLILYVDGGTAGADTGGCGGSANPCRTISYALDQRVAQIYVRVRDGNYFDNLDLSGDTLTFIGAGADLVGAASGPPVVDVKNGADITFDGMTVRGATNAPGISCSGSSTKLVLRGGVSIQANGGRGLDSNGCGVSIEQSFVLGNDSVGVFINGGSVDLHHSEISGNDGGGMQVVQASLSIVNNFIVDNGKGGGGGSDVAGLMINNIGFTTVEMLAFNTIADNRARDGSTTYGVSCNVSGASTSTVSSNVVYNGGSNTVVSGNCVWKNSLYKGAAGMQNIDENPKFVSSTDFHLESDSPCRDKGETIPAVDTDYDGDPRPEGSGHDMGADEFWP